MENTEKRDVKQETIIVDDTGMGKAIIIDLKELTDWLRELEEYSVRPF